MYLVLYYSPCTPLLAALSYLIMQQTITSMLTTLNFFYHSRLLIYLKNITHLENTIANVMFPTGCHPTSLPSILLKLSFLLLVYLNKLTLWTLYSITLPFICLLWLYITMSFSWLLNLGVIFDKNLSFAQHISAIFMFLFLFTVKIERVCVL